MDPSAGLEAAKKVNIFPLPVIWPWYLGRSSSDLVIILTELSQNKEFRKEKSWCIKCVKSFFTSPCSYIKRYPVPRTNLYYLSICLNFGNYWRSKIASFTILFKNTLPFLSIFRDLNQLVQEYTVFDIINLLGAYIHRRWLALTTYAHTTNLFTIPEQHWVHVSRLENYSGRARS
jgi:hypothetical protein